MSSNVSSLVFDKARTGGPWEAYSSEKFPADEVMCKGPSFFGLHHSSYIEDVFVSEEKSKGDVGG